MSLAKKAVHGFFLLFCVFFFCGMSLMPNAEELKTLKEQGDEEAAKERLMAEQDKSFEAVRAALIKKDLRSGERSRDIGRKFGKPVSVEKKEKTERWLYKARGRKKWLDVPRAWLSFDESGRLSGWECAHTDCGSG